MGKAVFWVERKKPRYGVRLLTYSESGSRGHAENDLFHGSEEAADIANLHRNNRVARRQLRVHGDLEAVLPRREVTEEREVTGLILCTGTCFALDDVEPAAQVDQRVFHRSLATLAERQIRGR